MEEKDNLQHILNQAGKIEFNLDVEDRIMRRIEAHEVAKEKVKLYKLYGKISFVVSLVLLVCYIWRLTGIQTHALFAKLPVQLSFTVLGLILIFLEMEIGISKLSSFKRSPRS